MTTPTNSAPTREQVLDWCLQANETAKYRSHDWNIALCTLARADLSARIAELEAEVGRLEKVIRVEKIASANCAHKDEADELRRQLAACQEESAELTKQAVNLFEQLAAEQLRNERLREALGPLLAELMDIAVSKGANSVSMPDKYVSAAVLIAESHDTAALDAYVAEQVKKAQLKEPQ